jgi:hypothetical protein
MTEGRRKLLDGIAMAKATPHPSPVKLRKIFQTKDKGLYFGEVYYQNKKPSTVAGLRLSLS